jgi:LAS superfamily LD-carboxypeptidase LdcB
MIKKFRILLTAVLISGCASTPEAPPVRLNVEKLSPAHIAEVKILVSTLEPFIAQKDQEGKLPELTYEELEVPLAHDQRRLLRAFRDLRASEVGSRIPFRGFSQGEKDLIRLSGQKIRIKGVEKELPPQFLTPHVYEADQLMMRDMEKDIGRRLFVESGYRSSTHQLYLFIYYLSNHDYSIRETVKWVALPGYSEHGDPDHLAIDFINAEGINGEYNIPEFEALPEFKWLMNNAAKYGFVLSYPKNDSSGITYEPWHWRYDGESSCRHC